MSLWFQEAPPVGRVAELGSLGGVTAPPHHQTTNKGNVTLTNWITVIVAAAQIINSWIVWLVNRRKTSAEPTPAKKKAMLTWLLSRSRWVYLSSAIISFGLLALLLQVFSDEPLTRFSVFIISYLTTVIIVQVLLTVIVHMRRDLQHAKTMADLYAHSHFS